MTRSPAPGVPPPRSNDSRAVVQIVSATRLGEAAFWSGSPLGTSLRRIWHDERFSVHIAFGNRRGLPEIYNAQIEQASASTTLLFVHDDVWLDDFYFIDRLLEGLDRFDIVGLAGCKRRVHRQAAWCFVDDHFTPADTTMLSGRVAHAVHPFGVISTYGAAPAQCELLDGLFLAARASTLQRHDVRFDPQFDFHFYDLDFCRTASTKDRKLGTWPICVTHQGKGTSIRQPGARCARAIVPSGQTDRSGHRSRSRAGLPACAAHVPARRGRARTDDRSRETAAQARECRRRDGAPCRAR